MLSSSHSAHLQTSGLGGAHRKYLGNTQPLHRIPRTICDNARNRYEIHCAAPVLHLYSLRAASRTGSMHLLHIADIGLQSVLVTK